MKSIYLAILGLILPTAFAFAATAPGSLIKGPGDSVYYLGQDAKRYVFPTANTYKSWYTDFSSVQTISATELASYTLGGNVTYKPGARMIKITTDPKVYAISAGGVLRWVQNEDTASALYGADWNKKIDDVSDTFFTDYSVGSPIIHASDFIPSSAMQSAISIDIDKKTIPPPTPPPIQDNFTFTVSKQHIQGGDTVLLTGISTRLDGISKIELYGDGQLVGSCPNQSCTGEFTVPRSGTKDSYIFEGHVINRDNSITSKTITLLVQTNGDDKVLVTIAQGTILPNQMGNVTVDIDTSIAILRVDIYVGGTSIKACTDGARRCIWSDYIQNAKVGDINEVYAKVTDTAGRVYISKKYSINTGTNDAPSVKLLVGKSMIYIKESVDLAASASDNDGIASIEILQDGVVMKHCDSGAPCTVNAGPFLSAGSVNFSARAIDLKGMAGITQNSTSLLIQ